MTVRSISRISCLMGAASAIAVLTTAGTAHAAGVTAGTIITSSASATYNSGTGTTAINNSVSSNTVKVTVDEIIDVSVKSMAENAYGPAGTQTVSSWQISNTGNGSESFKVTVAPVAGGQFQPTIDTIAIDSNNNGVYDPLVDQVIQNDTATPALSADTSLLVFVVATIPAGVANAQSANLELKATSTTGTGAAGTVVDSAGGDGGTNAVAGSSGGTYTADVSVVANSEPVPSVSLVKTQAVVNRFDTTHPVPGATITYTIKPTISGSTANNLVVSDGIPTGTTYVPGSLKLDGNALTDAVDADAGAFSNSTVSVSLGNVAIGTAKTITFSVKIN